MTNEANQLMKTTYEYSVRLIAAANAFIYNISREDYGKALYKFWEFPTGLEWFIDALDALNNSGDIKFRTESFESIKNAIEQIVKAFENVDYVLIKDLFEYEVLPFLRNEQDNLMLTLGVNPHDPFPYEE